jgi:hypothetical protein
MGDRKMQNPLFLSSCYPFSCPTHAAGFRSEKYEERSPESGKTRGLRPKPNHPDLEQKETEQTEAALPLCNTSSAVLPLC